MRPALLAVVGLMLALSLVVANVGGKMGVCFLGIAFWQSLGAGLLLTILSGRQPGLGKNWRDVLRYGAGAGLLSIAIPQTVLIAGAVHLGSGVAGVFRSLSPPLSLLLAHLFAVQRVQRNVAIGVGLGLVGTLLMVGSNVVACPNQWLWIAIVATAPIALSSGNVFRTSAWPAGAGPSRLAGAIYLAAAMWLLPPALLFKALPIPFVAGWKTTALLGVSVLLTTGAGAAQLRLQKLAGPVYIGLCGYAAAALGVPLGALLLHEHVRSAGWVGVILIVAGVAMNHLMKRAQG